MGDMAQGQGQVQGAGQVAPQQQSAPASDSGANSQSLGWRAGLPKEYQNHESFSKYSKVGDLAKDFLDLRDRSQRMITLPNEKSTPDEVTAYYKAIGRPDKADGYTLPEGAKDHPSFAAIRAAAHDAGMSVQSFQKFLSKLNSVGSEGAKAQMEAQRKAQEESVKALRAEWKDGFDSKQEQARRALKSFADEKTIEQLTKSGLVNQAWFMKFMAQAGEKLGEGKFIRGSAQRKPERQFVVDYKSD